MENADAKHTRDRISSFLGICEVTPTVSTDIEGDWRIRATVSPFCVPELRAIGEQQKSAVCSGHFDSDGSRVQLMRLPRPVGACHSLRPGPLRPILLLQHTRAGQHHLIQDHLAAINACATTWIPTTRGTWAQMVPQTLSCPFRPAKSGPGIRIQLQSPMAHRSLVSHSVSPQ